MLPGWKKNNFSRKKTQRHRTLQLLAVFFACLYVGLIVVIHSIRIESRQ